MRHRGDEHEWTDSRASRTPLGLARQSFDLEVRLQNMRLRSLIGHKISHSAVERTTTMIFRLGEVMEIPLRETQCAPFQECADDISGGLPPRQNGIGTKKWR